MRITKKKITSVAVGAAVVALGASAAFAYWTGTGNASGDTMLSNGLDFTNASFTFGGSGTLHPGGSVPVTAATITNDNDYAVTVTGFSAAAFTFDGGHSSCNDGWFSINLPAGPVSFGPIPANTTVPIPPATLAALNLALSMTNEIATDQEACKGAHIFVNVPLSIQN